MHLGFDISQTGQAKAGCGFFSHALAEALIASNRIDRITLYPTFGDFFLDSQMPDQNPYPGPGVAYLKPQRTLSEARAFWSQKNLGSTLGHPDLLHSNNFWCPHALGDVPLIYTLYDLAFTEHPEWTTEPNRTGCFEGVFRASILADWIVAISKSSRNHFLELFPYFPPERIEVIYPCSRYRDNQIPGVQPYLLNESPPDSFWLSVGTIEPRKNLTTLAEAYAHYRELSVHPLKLVFAGGTGWLMASFKEKLSELGILDHVIFTGYVSDDELVWLYRNCFANIYPSYFEGFGLPVLEALQFGAPTLASQATSIPEVAGKAALLIDPYQIESLTHGMLELERNPGLRERLKALGPSQAARFDRTLSTEKLIRLYERAMNSPRKQNTHSHFT